VKKITKLSSLLVAVLLLSMLSGVQLVSAAGVSVEIQNGDTDDFVSNNAGADGADNTFNVVITDSGRDTDSAAGTDTIAAANITVNNKTSGATISVTTTAAQETATGVFTVAITVVTSTSVAADAKISAVDGEEIEVLYTTAGSIQVVALTEVNALTSIAVDGAGPTFSSMSPADDLKTRFGALTLQASVSDSGVGMGTAASAVRSLVTVSVNSAEFTPVVGAQAADLSWPATQGTTVSLEGDVLWYVSATDLLGNTNRTDSDEDTAGDQDNTISIDFTAPAITTDATATDGTNTLIATTGDVLDTSGDTSVIDAATDTRTGIRVGFSETLLGTSINADGSDFLVLVGENQQTIVSAVWDEDLPQHVFITLSEALSADATPVVRVVREITDTAGNATNTGEVTAVDGVAPELTVTVADVTTETLVIQVSADEASANPTASTGVIVKQETDNATGAISGTAETATFENVTDTKTWTWTYTFETDGTEDGIYNVYVTIADTTGNTSTVGSATTSTLDDSQTFEVDTQIPAATITPETTDDTGAFIIIDFTAEGTEYDGDSTATITTITATVDDVEVTASTIDSKTFTIAAPTGGYTEEDHSVVVTATDAAGNVVTFDAVTVSITERADLSIALKPGFNLISLPGVPASTAINDVIGADHPINQVLTYDPTVDGGWLIAERGDDGLFAGTLTHVSSNLAYIVRTTSFEALTVTIPRRSVGEQVLPPTVALADGWNLVPVVDLSDDVAGGADISGYFTDVGQKILKLDAQGRLAAHTSAAGTVGVGYWVFSDGGETLVP
jgi:hypothetical protein